MDHAYPAVESSQVQQLQGGKNSGGKGGKKGDKGGDKSHKDGGKIWNNIGGGSNNHHYNNKDKVYVADGMPSDASGCLYCGRGGRNAKICPKKAAEKRGEVETLMADFARTGAACQICSSIGLEVGDRRARHHNLAAQDAFGSQSAPAPAPGGKGNPGGQPQQQSASGGNNKGQNKGSKSEPKGKGKTKGSKDAGEWKSDAPCKLFMANKCTYGDRRRFSHAESSNPAQERPAGRTEQLSVARESQAAYNLGPYIVGV